MNPALIIGNKNYSTWSLRPWLLLKANGIAFDEVRIPLYQQDSKAAILVHSPSGKVPGLRDGSVSVWESLAICEYIAERWPQAHCWPADAVARAHARSISAEMHAGFGTLRGELPMNCRRMPAAAPEPKTSVIAEELARQIRRIDTIWSTCRAEPPTGDFLFGGFGVADAMFAPVVLRFSIYDVSVSGTARAYMDTMLALPALQEWVAAAQRESEVLAQFER
jgi:glutathione S-transferase